MLANLLPLHGVDIQGMVPRPSNDLRAIRAPAQAPDAKGVPVRQRAALMRPAWATGNPAVARITACTAPISTHVHENEQHNHCNTIKRACSSKILQHLYVLSCSSVTSKCRGSWMSVMLAVDSTAPEELMLTCPPRNPQQLWHCLLSATAYLGTG